MNNIRTIAVSIGATNTLPIALIERFVRVLNLRSFTDYVKWYQENRIRNENDLYKRILYELYLGNDYSFKDVLKNEQ